MKKELTIEHLAAYLPYNTTFKYGKSNVCILTSDVIARREKHDTIKGISLILRPLSDLTRPITHNGETFVPVEWFEIGDSEGNTREYGFGNIKLMRILQSVAEQEIHHDTMHLPYGVVVQLHSWHFDTFGLIESNLAIDINTLNP
jgi:pterin-4a-carbinolamine dehydratase